MPGDVSRRDTFPMEERRKVSEGLDRTVDSGEGVKLSVPGGAAEVGRRWPEEAKQKGEKSKDGQKMKRNGGRGCARFCRRRGNVEKEKRKHLVRHSKIPATRT